MVWRANVRRRQGGVRRLTSSASKRAEGGDDAVASVSLIRINKAARTEATTR